MLISRKGRQSCWLYGKAAEVEAAIEMARRREKTRRRREVKKLEQMVARSPFGPSWRLLHAAAVCGYMQLIMHSNDHLTSVINQKMQEPGLERGTFNSKSRQCTTRLLKHKKKCRVSNSLAGQCHSVVSQRPRNSTFLSKPK